MLWLDTNLAALGNKPHFTVGLLLALAILRDLQSSTEFVCVPILVHGSSWFLFILGLFAFRQRSPAFHGVAQKICFECVPASIRVAQLF